VRIRARTTTIPPPTISSANVSRGFRGGCYSFAPKPRNDKNIKEDRTVTTVGRHFKSAEFPPKISISIPLRRRSQEVKKSGRQRGAGYTRLLSFFLSLSLSKGSLVVVICALGDAREREREKQLVFVVSLTNIKLFSVKSYGVVLVFARTRFGTKKREREVNNTKNISENVHTWASTARDRTESFRVPANSLPRLYRCLRGVVVQFRDIERVSRARLVAGKYQNTQAQTRGRGERKIVARDARGRGVVEKLRGVFEGVRMRRDALDVRGE